MRVVIIGAGQVGRSIAHELQSDHDVVVVERSPARLELIDPYDVMSIRGNGASIKMLKEAGVHRADLTIACTDVDEVNMVACAASKHLGNPFTIARVHDPDYIESWEPGDFGVDFMVCSELITARAIGQLIGVPAARGVHTFAKGKITTAELAVDPSSPLAGRPIEELDLPSSLRIVSLIRKGEVIIPSGENTIEPGDLVVSVGIPEALGELNRRAGGRPMAENIVILGGGRIGFRLAQTLQQRGLRPKLVEAGAERSRWLAEQLPYCQVFQSDATDLAFLEHERFATYDVGISVMDKDERNLLSALLLKTLGVTKVIAGVAEPEYAEVFERVGVDVAVSARKVVAEEIIRFTRRRIAGLSTIEGNRAEILEMEVSPESPLVGTQLEDADFPAGATIGAIVRGNRVIIPGGDDALHIGDLVIVFSRKSAVSEVEDIL